MSKTEERIQSKLDLIEENFSEEGFRNLKRVWLPAGSGPTSACAMICALLEKIANKEGWNINPLPTIEEVEANGKLLSDYDAEGYDEDGVIGFCEVYDYKGTQYIITDWNELAIGYGHEKGKTIIHK